MITNEAAVLQKKMTRSQNVESHLEGPEHPSLWLFFSSQAPHIIETGPRRSAQCWMRLRN